MKVFLLSLSSLVSLCSAVMVVQHSRASVPIGFVDHGSAPAEQSITLRLALASNNMAGLEQTLLSVSDPTSASYGQYLTAEETKAFVQPSPDTVSAVNAWATANGLTTTVISPFGEWVSLTVPISKANALFDAQFHTFTHSDSGEQIIRTLSFSFPSQLVGHLVTAHPTTTFTDPDVRLSPIITRGENEVRDVKEDLVIANPSCNSTITPRCLEEIYGIPILPATRKDNTLLVTAYVQQFAQNADLQTFLTEFQPLEKNTTTFTVENLDGGLNTQNASQAGVEANLDTQYTVGIALGVPVTFLTVGGDFTTALLDTTTFLANVPNPPSAMTTSYGTTEAALTPSLAVQICNGYMALGARGVSVIFASGDGGVRGNHDSLRVCNNNTFMPVFPASCPFITSVGSTIGINPERAINFTGGGFSNVFARPSYQNKVVPQFLSTIPSDFGGIFNATGRGYPDVALQGWNFEVVSGGETGLVGGTSASSPSFASIIALINDRLALLGKPRLGFLNPFIYSKASFAFNDITIGKNTGFVCPSNVTAFTAAKGWDPLTGFGTPNFVELLAAALL